MTRTWHVVDADGLVLGRLATEVARVLRGKHKPIFAPHIDTGDHVIVVNAAKVVLTANKGSQKIAYHHSGYPGSSARRATPSCSRPSPKRSSGVPCAACSRRARSARQAQEAQGLRRPGAPARRPDAPDAPSTPRDEPPEESRWPSPDPDHRPPQGRRRARAASPRRRARSRSTVVPSMSTSRRRPAAWSSREPPAAVQRRATTSTRPSTAEACPARRERCASASPGALVELDPELRPIAQEGRSAHP